MGECTGQPLAPNRTSTHIKHKLTNNCTSLSYTLELPPIEILELPPFEILELSATWYNTDRWMHWSTSSTKQKAENYYKHKHKLTYCVHAYPTLLFSFDCCFIVSYNS